MTQPAGGKRMAVATRKTELSPLEAIIVETTLGDLARGNRRDGALARIQQLTKERQQLYAKSAARPFLAPTNAPLIRAISAENGSASAKAGSSMCCSKATVISKRQLTRLSMR